MTNPIILLYTLNVIMIVLLFESITGLGVLGGSCLRGAECVQNELVDVF